MKSDDSFFIMKDDTSFFIEDQEAIDLTTFFHLPKHPTRALYGLYAATFLLRIGFAATIITLDRYLFAILAPGHGGGEHLLSVNIQIAMVSSTFFIAEILLSGYFGTHSDTHDPRRVILFGTGLGGLVMLLYAPTPNLGALFGTGMAVFYLAVIHFFHGVASSAKVSPTLGYISRFSKRSDRGAHMGAYDASLMMGRVLGILVGGVLYTWVGADIDPSKVSRAYPILMLFLLGATLLILLFVKPLDPLQPDAEFSILEELTNSIRTFLDPKRRDMILPWLSMASLVGLIAVWGPGLLMREGGASGVESGLVGGVIGFALGAPGPLWGRVSDRIGRKKTMLIGMAGLLTTIVWGAILLGIGMSFTDPLFLLLIIPPFVCIAAFIPAFLGRLGDTGESSGHGAVMSGYHFALAIGEMSGIFVGAIFYSFGLILFARMLNVQPDGNPGGIIGIGLLALMLIALIVVGTSRVKSDEEVIPGTKGSLESSIPASNISWDS